MSTDEGLKKIIGDSILGMGYEGGVTILPPQCLFPSLSPRHRYRSERGLLPLYVSGIIMIYS